MKTAILILVLAAAANAQTPGTVVKSTTSTSSVVGTAGSLACTLTNTSPALPTGVHVVCINSGNTILVMDSVIPVGANGMVGSMTVSGNSVSWLVNQPVAGPYAWQMVANGVSGSGTF